MGKLYLGRKRWANGGNKKGRNKVPAFQFLAVYREELSFFFVFFELAFLDDFYRIGRGVELFFHFLFYL